MANPSSCPCSGTTLARLEDGVPAAQLRFKRVAHDFDDFAPVVARLAGT